MLTVVFALMLVYIIGSIPSGYWVTRAVKHIDIRSHGSGNIGATNVARIVGLKWGVFVFIADFLKGLVGPVLLEKLPADANAALFICAGLCAVGGHNWSVFLRFRGGKGVSTSAGAAVGLCLVYPPLWIPLGGALITWAGVFFFTKIVSCASLLAPLVFFLISLFIPVPVELKIFSFILCVFIIIRHKQNIYDLLQKKSVNSNP